MAGTVIIGKVGVKVYPVTDEFWRKVKREVEQGEGRVEAHVPVNLEDEKLRRQMRDLLKDLKRQIDSSNLKANVDLDSGAVVQEAKKLDREIKAQLDDVKVKVSTESTGASGISDADGQKAIKELQGRLRVEKAVAKANSDAARSQGQAEQSISRQLAARLKVEDMVNKANADAAKAAEREARALRDAAAEGAKLRREVGKLEFDRTFQRTAADVRDILGEVDAEIRDIDKHLNERLRIEISGMSEAERDIDKLKIKLEETNAKITPEIDEFSRRRLIHEAEKLKNEIEDKTKDLEVSFNMNAPTVAIRYLGARLAILARDRLVRYIPVVSKAAATKAATVLAALSGARLGGKLLEDLGDLVKNLDKNIPLIATLGTGIAGLAGWALSASANLFSISTELARIGPLALALPGILTGIGIAATAFVIAMTDIKKVVPGVVSQWRDLKKTISQNFWRQAADPLRELTRVIMPQLTKGLARASTEVGTLFGSFGTDLAKRLTGNGALTRMFSDLGKSLAILTDHTSAWAGIITILGEQGAGTLPRLAAWFGTISDNFNAFLEQAQYTGALQDWVDNGITALMQLGGAIKQIGRFLGGLGKIANKAGGSTFASIGETFKGAADAINKAHFQDQMVQVLLAADQAMTNIARKSGPGLTQFFDRLATTAQTVLPMVGNIIGTMLGGVAKALSGAGFQIGVENFFQGVLDLVNDLQPALGPVADAIGSVLTLAGQMATAFGPSLATILTTVANVVKTIAPYVGDAVSSLAGPFGDILKSVAPSIERIARAVGPKISDFAKGFGDFLHGIKPNITKVFDHLADFLESATKFKPSDIQGFFDNLKELANSSLDVLTQVIDFGKWINGPDGQNAINSVKLLAAVVGQVAGQATLAADALDTLKGKGDALGTKKNKADNGGKFDLGQYIKDTINNNPILTDVLGPVGGTIIQGLVNGFEGAKQNVQKWLEGLTLLIPIWKGPPGTDATLLQPAGYAIIMSLIAGFDQAKNSVMTWLQGLTNAIKGFFAGGGTWLVSPGLALGQGLAKGIGSALRSVKTAGGRLLQGVKDATDHGGALTGNGSALGSGFARGVRGRSGAARGAGEALASAAKSGSGSSSAFFTGINFGAGFAKGVRAKTGDAYAAGHALGVAAKKGAADAGKVASPAKEMIKIGRFYGQGMEIGLGKEKDTAYSAGLGLGQAALKGAGDQPHSAIYASGSRVGNAFADGITSAKAAVDKSFAGLTGGLQDSDLTVAAGKVSGAVSAQVSASLADITPTSTDVPTQGPLVGNLTLVSANDNVGEDLSEIEFELRRMSRGGVHG